MVQRVAYREEHYPTAGSCVRGIRELVSLDWTLLQVRGARNGPFLVVCRKVELS